MENFDIGKGDVFLGDSFSRPYFFESRTKRMMEDVSPLNITFKTWKGEFFQFRIYQFHSVDVMLLASTLQDTFYFIRPTISKTMEVAKRGNQKHPIKGSYTGYCSWGGYFNELLENLQKHLDEQEIYFTDEVTTAIYLELKRRKKAYVKKCRISNT